MGRVPFRWLPRPLPQCILLLSGGSLQPNAAPQPTPPVGPFAKKPNEKGEGGREGGEYPPEVLPSSRLTQRSAGGSSAPAHLGGAHSRGLRWRSLPGSEASRRHRGAGEGANCERAEGRIRCQGGEEILGSRDSDSRDPRPSQGLTDAGLAR